MLTASSGLNSVVSGRNVRSNGQGGKQASESNRLQAATGRPSQLKPCDTRTCWALAVHRSFLNGIILCNRGSPAVVGRYHSSKYTTTTEFFGIPQPLTIPGEKDASVKNKIYVPLSGARSTLQRFRRGPRHGPIGIEDAFNRLGTLPSVRGLIMT